MASGMTRAVPSLCIKTTMVAGAGADTNMAIAGIAMEDTLISVLHISTTASVATIVDALATTNITSAGNIQNTGATTSDSLWVQWHDASA